MAPSQHDDQPSVSRSSLITQVRRRPTAAFFAGAYAVSWTCWGIAAALGEGRAARVVFLLGVFGPAVAAAAVTWAVGGSLRAWARRIVRWRVAPRYYLYAAGLPALLYAAVNLVLALLGQDVDLTLAVERAPGYLGTLVFVALLGGGLEEPGWRGFALPRLQQRLNPLRATLVLGLLWGLWHLPVNGPLAFVVPLTLAFFYTWLYNRSGSVLLCILLHGSFTAAQDHLVLIAEEVHGVTDAVILGAYVGGAALLVLGTRGRLGHRGDPPTVASPPRTAARATVGGP
jgi:uncharacterized protein